MRRVYCSGCSAYASVIYAEHLDTKESWLLRIRCACMDVITETYAYMGSDADSEVAIEHVTALKWENQHVQLSMERAERQATRLLTRVEALRSWMVRA